MTTRRRSLRTNAANLATVATFAQVARACGGDALDEAIVARNLTREHSARRADAARVNVGAQYYNARVMWVHALAALVA